MQLDFDMDPNSLSHNLNTDNLIKNITERLWAYERIKDLIKQMDVAENNTIAEIKKQEALQLSLK